MFMSIFQDFMLASALAITQFFVLLGRLLLRLFLIILFLWQPCQVHDPLGFQGRTTLSTILHHHSRVMHLRCHSHSPFMGSRVQDLATSPPWQKTTHASSAPSPPSHTALYFGSEGGKGGTSTGTKAPGDLKMWEVPLANGCLHLPWDGKMSH